MSGFENSERVGQHPQQKTSFRSSTSNSITPALYCELEELAIKYSHLCVYPDLAAMTGVEWYGLFLFLRGLHS